MKRLTLLAFALTLPMYAQFGNATRIQSRPVSPTAPSDTNVICWDAAAGTWKPCTVGGAGGVTGTGAATEVTYWTGTSSVSGNANLLFNPALLTRGQFQVGLLNGNAAFDDNIEGWWGLNGTANVGTITGTGASSGLVVQQQGAGGFVQGISLMAFGTDNTVEGAAVDALNMDAGYNSAIDDDTRIVRGADIAAGNAGSGIVGTVVGVSVAGNPFCSNCPTVTRAGVHVTSQGQNSGVTNAYGIWLDDQVNATNNYAIKAGTGKIEFDELKTTGSASGKKVVCVDTSTGLLYSSTGDTGCTSAGTGGQSHVFNCIMGSATGTTVLSTGDTGCYGDVGPYSGTINRLDIIGNAASLATCSITVDVWKANAAYPTSGGKISASAPATLSTAKVSQSGSLSGWTTAVAANDVFGASIASVTGCVFASMTVYFQ